MAIRRELGRAVLVAVLVLTGAVGILTTAAHAQPGACAWRFMSNDTVLNVAFPDSNATYWVLPYALGPGDRIDLSGRYPQARYFSLNTYGTNLDTVDTLRDEQIAPDPGNTNPFAADTAGGGGTWRASVVTGPADHTRNEIAALPSGAAAQSVPVGFLIIRVYVPDDPSSASGGVALPDATLVYGGTSVSLQPCGAVFDPAAYGGPVEAIAERGFDAFVGGAASGAFPGGTPEATFVSPASTSGLFPNGDNKYLGAGLSYQPGRIVVVRGLAPSFPDTRAGAPVTGPGSQVRYWSMCQNDQVSPYPVVACAADFQTARDDAGYYTYVVAAPQDLPARAAADPTVTVVPWGSTDPKKVLFLRNMLPTDAYYPQSVQAAQNSADPAETMGAYYPRATYCESEVFQAGGAAACFGV